MTAPAPPQRGFDPEAEQEVDFARYVRLLAVRWWLLAAGLVAGAVIGYLVSLGGTQVYSATATVYLGQPYTPPGSALIQDPQTNPSSVAQVVNSQAVIDSVAHLCHTKPGAFKKGISTQAVATGASTKGGGAAINPLVKVSVQSKKGKVAACAANKLAAKVVTALGVYPSAKIANLKAQIASDNQGIKSINTAIAKGNLSDTDKLLLQTTLRSYQTDRTTNSQLLLLATKVESPYVFAHAAPNKITARSRRNTVVIAALIGLILGAIAALFWDRFAALSRD
ncbi:MAG TPA: Wzz/FepE/Etk N-terminal domain-containing protein [Gaiellaceae bacterium]|nr:Wzz/FepE/Etk N-terminal domain-containing protein [Gaiellaceae bacterium]